MGHHDQSSTNMDPSRQDSSALYTATQGVMQVTPDMHIYICIYTRQTDGQAGLIIIAGALCLQNVLNMTLKGVGARLSYSSEHDKCRKNRSIDGNAL